MRPHRLLAALIVLTVAAACTPGEGVESSRSSLLDPPSENPTTTTTSAPVDRVGVVEGWDPVLASRKAEPSTCPSGVDPWGSWQVAGERPEPGWVSSQAATYDSARGQVVYVDVVGSMWTFDVCTRRWQRIASDRAPLSGETLVDVPPVDPRRGQLAYDADSDRVVWFGEDIWVYSPEHDVWSQRDAEGATAGVFYDEASGLIVGLRPVGMGEVAAYDLEAGEWITLGAWDVRERGVLVGRSQQTGLLVFQTVGDPGPTPTYLLDPRTGEVSVTASPGPRLWTDRGAFSYSAGVDTAYVLTDDHLICRFDPKSGTWEPCYDPVGGPGVEDAHFAAMVEDPLNNRLILINSYQGEPGAFDPDGYSDDIWAINLETGRWHQLLPPSEGRVSLQALLQPEDLPPDGWRRSAAPLWNWGSRASITVFGCPEMDAIGAEPPLSSLIARKGISWEATGRRGVGVNEAIFADTPEKIADAFDHLAGILEDCLATPERWSELLASVDEGDYIVAGEYDLPPVGDAAFGVQFTLLNRNEPQWSGRWDFRIAVVEADDVLVAIQLHEVMTSPQISDDQFLGIVVRAVKRFDE